MISPELLGRALGEAANPELARVAMSRIGERREARELLERPEIVPAAARLLGFSASASDFFVAHPEELEALADLRTRTRHDLMEELGTDVRTLGVSAGLRRFRRRAFYRVAARDLAGADLDDVVMELSHAAEVCLDVAVDAVGASERLAVVAMGKLGGRELNYGSDVDVVFLHAGVGAERQEVASRMAVAAVGLLSEPTAEGVALRVDASLRPDGRSGPLSRSLDSVLEYYERHAATWERQALVKARPVAGDVALGLRFVEGVRPLVYPAVLPATAVEDVRATKARVEELVRARGKEAVEVKRGRGGIRDVEFAVQLLQLVHGRTHAAVRVPGTLEALRALADEGFVRPDDAESLADSYRFLRRLEHRLQLAREVQTHELPAAAALLGPLARAMGADTADRLRLEHRRHTENVRTLHERLFYRPLLEAIASAPTARPGIDRAAAEEVLLGLGFADPAGAYERFATLVDPSTRLGKVLDILFPVVAPALAFSPVPDAGLVRFSRVAEALRPHEGIADALAERPDAVRRLATLVAVSSAFSDMLVARPDLAGAVFEVSSTERPRFPPDADLELVRVAGAHVTRELRVPETGRRLADVADGVVAAALAAADPAVPMAALGLGRFGAQELTFASDLDLLFVYEGEGHEDFAAASSAAEATLAGIRDAGWQPDVDLRPEGRSGPLARSMASYLEYWQRWAETWEFQALLRGRFVAGDEGLGRRFLSEAEKVAYPPALAFEQVAAIRRMRVRMEEERIRSAEARRFHFKLGYGSLADVQFAVELVLMQHGAGRPEVRATHTLEAIERLTQAGLLQEEVARALAEAYVFLLEVKAALEVERRVPAAALPAAPEDQAGLARRLGYGEQARRRFLEDYRRNTRRARRAMERVFYGERDRG